MDVFDAEVFAFDPTPSAALFVRNHDLSKRPRFHFSETGLAVEDGVEGLWMPTSYSLATGSPKDPDDSEPWVQVPVEMQTLQTIMKRLGHRHIDILKMDIEGAENRVIPDMLGRDIPVDQLCFEFHGRSRSDAIRNAKQLAGVLGKHGYAFASVSGFSELTFVAAR